MPLQLPRRSWDSDVFNVYSLRLFRIVARGRGNIGKCLFVYTLDPLRIYEKALSNIPSVFGGLAALFLCYLQQLEKHFPDTEEVADGTCEDTDVEHRVHIRTTW